MRQQWFDVDLDELRLAPSDVSGWPSGMTSAKTRMKEEALEFVMAVNLDVLFPGEELLLVVTDVTDDHF